MNGLVWLAGLCGGLAGTMLGAWLGWFLAWKVWTKQRAFEAHVAQTAMAPGVTGRSVPVPPDAEERMRAYALEDAITRGAQDLRRRNPSLSLEEATAHAKALLDQVLGAE